MRELSGAVLQWLELAPGGLSPCAVRGRIGNVKRSPVSDNSMHTFWLVAVPCYPSAGSFSCQRGREGGLALPECCRTAGSGRNAPESWWFAIQSHITVMSYSAASASLATQEACRLLTRPVFLCRGRAACPSARDRSGDGPKGERPVKQVQVSGSRICKAAMTKCV